MSEVTIILIEKMIENNHVNSESRLPRCNSCGAVISQDQNSNFSGKCPECVRLQKFPILKNESVNFCHECGKPTTIRCHKCKISVCSKHSRIHRPNWKFQDPMLLCGKCGVQLKESRLPLQVFIGIIFIIMFILAIAEAQF